MPAFKVESIASTLKGIVAKCLLYHLDTEHVTPRGLLAQICGRDCLLPTLPHGKTILL